MSLVLYELLGKDDLRFSPYAWRARMALAHKGLKAEIVPCKFTDKAKFAFSGQDKVPVLVDGGETVFDSWRIACHIEDRHPGKPSLFGGPQARALARVVNFAVDSQVHLVLVRLILGDIFSNVHPDDRDYFRKTREARFGMTIEAIHAAREDHREAWTNVLGPYRLALREQPYLSGQSPAYADYVLFGTFQWARCASPYPLLKADDTLYSWRERMLDLYDGLGRKAKGFPVDG